MKLRIEVLEADGVEVAEVLVINGGAESVAGDLGLSGDAIEVDVKVPQAVVIREKPVA